MQFYPLRLWRKNVEFDFMSFKKYYYYISLFFISFSIAGITFIKPNLGIDFIGGINIEISSPKNIQPDAIREVLRHANLKDLLIQSIGSNEVAIKVANSDQQNAFLIIEKIKSCIKSGFLDQSIEYGRIDFVGPQVGDQMIKNGIISFVLAFTAIVCYVWIRFHWRFSIGIIFSLMHDVVLCMGFASWSQIDFNLSSIAAILTIIGYSVNDSVVIYDRIRENLHKFPSKDITSIINASINQTLSRTTLTVLTTLIANLALILYGGRAIREFSIFIFFGILMGTFSSIFIAAPILPFFKLKNQSHRLL